MKKRRLIALLLCFCMTTGTFTPVLAEDEEDAVIVAEDSDPILHEEIYVSEESNEIQTLSETKASDTVVSGDFKYVVNDDGKTATITGFVGEESGDLVIPEGIDGYTVTVIGEKAFEGSIGFTGNIILPLSITTIEDYAFYNCNGFTGSLLIPESVITIGKMAFLYCEGLENIYVDEGNKNYSSVDGILFNKDKTVLIACPAGKTVENYIIPDSVTIIGDYAFHECDGFTGSLTIPHSVTTIGDGAFYSCSGFNGSLTIPDSVTTIGNMAFFSCQRFTGSLTIPDSITTIGNGAFNNCDGFTGNLTIPDSITIIGSSAFYDCDGFTGSLTIGDSVTIIGDRAFYDCSGFTGSLKIPDSVISIGKMAFYNCSGFTGSLTIPDGVTSIGNYAFSDCTGIESAYFYGDVPQEWGTYVFKNNADGFTIYSPEGNTSGWTSPTWTAPDGTVYNTVTFEVADESTDGEKVTFTQVSAGGYHSAAIDTNGSLWCWGWNKYGQLGNGTTEDQSTPIKIMDDVVAVSTGTYHTFAIKTDGTLWGWGSNTYYELGNGTDVDSTVPVKIMDNVFDASAGNSFSAIIKDDNSLWTWGYNYSGQLGNSSTNDGISPQQILEDVIDVSTGSNHMAAVTIDGTLWAWGYNDYGQLGDGTGISRKSPQKIMDNISAVSAGTSYTYAIDNNMSLWSMGKAQWDESAIAQPQIILKNITDVSAGIFHTTAIDIDNNLWCWGDWNEYGQIGNGSTTDEYSPVIIMDDVMEVSAGSEHTLAIKNDGTLWAWGYNAYGQLGDNAEHLEPYQVVVYDSDNIPEIPTSITTTFDTNEITLAEGATFNFEGLVSTTAETGLNDLQINIANAETGVGIKYHREDDIGTSEFDLSAVPLFVTGTTLTGEDQQGYKHTLELTAGTSWYVHLFATDNDGNSIGEDVVKKITITENPGEFLIGNKYIQTSFFGKDTFPGNEGENTPYILFTDNNKGEFYVMTYEPDFCGSYYFTYTVEGNKVTLLSDDEYGFNGSANKITLEIIDNTTLKIVSFEPETIDGLSYCVGWSAIGDTFETEITQVKPTVAGLRDNYTVTQGEDLLLEFSVTAGDDGMLNRVSILHNEVGTSFAPITYELNYSVNTFSADGLELSGDNYPLNTVGTHEFVVYASADNYTVTDNSVAVFTVTVVEGDECKHENMTATGVKSIDKKTYIASDENGHSYCTKYNIEYFCTSCNSFISENEWEYMYNEPHVKIHHYKLDYNGEFYICDECNYQYVDIGEYNDGVPQKAYWNTVADRVYVANDPLMDVEKYVHNYNQYIDKDDREDIYIYGEKWGHYLIRYPVTNSTETKYRFSLKENFSEEYIDSDILEKLVLLSDDALECYNNVADNTDLFTLRLAEEYYFETATKEWEKDTLRAFQAWVQQYLLTIDIDKLLNFVKGDAQKGVVKNAIRNKLMDMLGDKKDAEIINEKIENVIEVGGGIHATLEELEQAGILTDLLTEYLCQYSDAQQMDIINLIIEQIPSWRKFNGKNSKQICEYLKSIDINYNGKKHNIIDFINVDDQNATAIKSLLKNIRDAEADEKIDVYKNLRDDFIAIDVGKTVTSPKIEKFLKYFGTVLTATGSAITIMQKIEQSYYLVIALEIFEEELTELFSANSPEAQTLFQECLTEVLDEIAAYSINEIMGNCTITLSEAGNIALDYGIGELVEVLSKISAAEFGIVFLVNDILTSLYGTDEQSAHILTMPVLVDELNSTRNAICNNYYRFLDSPEEHYYDRMNLLIARYEWIVMYACDIYKIIAETNYDHEGILYTMTQQMKNEIGMGRVFGSFKTIKDIIDYINAKDDVSNYYDDLYKLYCIMVKFEDMGFKVY